MPALSKSEFAQVWEKPAIRIGMATVLIAVVISLLPNVYLYAKYGVLPPLGIAFKAWGMVVVAFGALYLVEPISYFPALGLTGTYMAFLAGNVSNMRLPCSALAQEVVGVEPGSQEAEIVSTLAIAGSIVVNLVFVTLAAFAGYGLLKLLPGSLNSAFKDYTAPAIFGAVYGQFSIRYPRMAVICLPLAVATLAVVTAISGKAVALPVTIVVAVFGTIAIGRLLYRKGKV